MQVDNEVGVKINVMDAQVSMSEPNGCRGTTDVEQVVLDIMNTKYKAAVDELRGLISKYAPTSDAYKLAASRARNGIPTVYWSKAANGGASGLAGFSVTGTDEATSNAIDAVEYTCIRYLNADNTGYDVVVKVNPDKRNTVLDADMVQKQVEAFYTEQGLSVDNVYRKKDNPLPYSYDRLIRVNVDSTPFVPEVQYASLLEEGGDIDTLAEEGPVGMTPHQIELESQRRAMEADGDKAFWDLPTDADVVEVIRGSALEDLVALLGAPTIPALPISATLSKALVLAGCEMSASEYPDPNDYLGDKNVGDQIPIEDMDVEDPEFKERIKSGVDLARVRIMTGLTGQACNFYCLNIAPSGSGKDIGGIMGMLARERGYYIGTGGTAEGLMDALMKTPNGLLEISEMTNYMNPNSYEYKATTMLTENFARGGFQQNYSKKQKGPTRNAAYAFPSLVASIQTDTMKKQFQSLLSTTGFYARFLVSEWGVADREVRAGLHPLYDELWSNARKALRRYKAVTGDILLKQGYFRELRRQFREATGGDSKSFAIYERLCNQYGPRIALALSVRKDSPFTSWTPVVTEEVLKKTEILIMWFFAAAWKRTMSGLGDAYQQEREEMQDKVLAAIKRKGKAGVTMRDIHRSLGQKKGSSSAQREAAKDELLSRGDIVVLMDTSMSPQTRAPRYVAL